MMTDRNILKDTINHIGDEFQFTAPYEIYILSASVNDLLPMYNN